MDGWMGILTAVDAMKEECALVGEKTKKKAARGVISGICVGAFGGRTFSLLTRASRYYYRQLQNYYFLISIMLC